MESGGDKGGEVNAREFAELVKKGDHGLRDEEGSLGVYTCRAAPCEKEIELFASAVSLVEWEFVTGGKKKN